MTFSSYGTTVDATILQTQYFKLNSVDLQSFVKIRKGLQKDGDILSP